MACLADNVQNLPFAKNLELQKESAQMSAIGDIGDVRTNKVMLIYSLRSSAAGHDMPCLTNGTFHGA